MIHTSRARRSGRSVGRYPPLGLLASALAVLLVAPAAGAQQDPLGPGEMSRVVGRLADAQTGEPIEQALVTLAPLQRRALSDSTGTFAFFDIPPGPYVLRVQHVAYGDQITQFDVLDVQSTVIAVTLTPVAIAVAPIDVQIEFRPRYLEDRGFYDRRAHGVGTFYDPRFVERWSVGSWARLSRPGRQARGDDPGFLRLITEMSPPLGSAGCLGGAPVIYLDGRKVALSFIEDMSTWEVGAVEVYSDTHGVPDFALDPEAACGVFAIWTNRWRRESRAVVPEREVELCVPSGEGVVIEGVVRDRFTGVLLPGAKIQTTVRESREQREAGGGSVLADREGRYRVCDIPRGHIVTLQATAADRLGNQLQFPADEPLMEKNLEIRLSGPGRVVGRVVDRSTEKPIATASVVVTGSGVQTMTDEQGYFSLRELPGDHLVEIRHLSYEPLIRPISVVADRTIDLRVELSADPIQVEPIVVTTLRVRRLEMRGFYDRRQWGERTGQGAFFAQEQIEQRAPVQISHLVGDVPGIELDCSGSSRGCLIGSTRGFGCDQLDVFVNGSLTIGRGRGDPATIDEIVRPHEISAVEVYPSASSVPAEFTGLSGRCGAVVIWTR